MPTPNPPSPSDAKIFKTEPLSPTSARWTSLQLTTYLDPTGKERTWEHASRPTRPANSDIDGVGIVAIVDTLPPNADLLLPPPIKPEGKEAESKGPYIILQKQFRPPLGKVVIEIPAGLVDEGESAAEAAVRELREETGFVGTVAGEGGEEEWWGVGPVMFNDPGFCTTNLSLVHLNINMSDPLNQHPKPQLEENEFIETFFTPLRTLWRACRAWEAEGYAIDARVGGVGEGVELGRRWGL